MDGNVLNRVRLITAIGCLFAAMASCSLIGCAAARSPGWMSWYAPPWQLDPDASLTEIVDYLNRNTVGAWRSNDVGITAKQSGRIPVTLTAILAVENPRNLRLVAANSFGNNEVDLGSNSDRFWFWMRRAEPKCIITASHEESAGVQRQLHVPFEPDWLMEALSVTRLDESELTLERGRPKDPLVRLIAERRSPQGETVRLVTVVDMQKGLTLQHVLYDARGALVAQADFGDYRKDELTAIVLPHRVDLHWPQTGLRLTLRLGHIEINPVEVPGKTWELPSYPDCPVLDLDAQSQQSPE